MQALELPESMDKKIQRKLQLEYFMSWAERQPKHLTKHVEFAPGNNVTAVLRSPESLSPRKDKFEFIKKWIHGANLVTNDGDIFYAKQACLESPAANENFNTGRMELNNPGSPDTPVKTDTYDEMLTPITASRKTFTATYPKTNDGDADNTGAGVDVATYLTSYTTGDFNATGIKGGSIHDNASPVGATKLLTHFTIASFDKTASDTLKMFVNHTMNGV